MNGIEPCTCGGAKGLLSGGRKTCGCCTSLAPLAPLPLFNAPGKTALDYRIGTQTSFFQTMRQRIAAFPQLSHLTDRGTDDPAIALLDGWATVADVLTFYQERIANECYLPTATERQSVLELVRLIGYELRPGVAATTYLAYTIDPNTGKTTVPRGSSSQSVPGPGETPQIFESDEDLTLAKAAWNNLNPRQTQPQTLPLDKTTRKPIFPESGFTVYLQGINTNLKLNDVLLIVTDAQSHLYRVLNIETNPPANLTKVTAESWYRSKSTTTSPVAEGTTSFEVYTFRSRASVFGNNAPLVPVPDQKGIITRYDEWSLIRSVGFGTEAFQLVVKLTEVTTTTGQGANAVTQTTWNIEINAVLGNLSGTRGSTPLVAGSFTLPILRADGSTAGNLNGTITLPSASGAGTPLPNIPAFTLDATFSEGIFSNAQLQVNVDNAGTVTGSGLNDNLDRVTVQSSLLTTPSNAVGGGNNPQLEAVVLPNPTHTITLHGRRFDFTATESSNRVSLDLPQSQILPGQFAMIEQRDVNGDITEPLVTLVQEVHERSRADYGITGKVTDLSLKDPWIDVTKSNLSVIRGTVVYAQSQKLDLTEEPILTLIQGNSIELDGLYEELPGELTPGKIVIVRGAIAQTGPLMAEAMTISTTATAPPGPKQTNNTTDTPRTTLTFTNPLAGKYTRSTVRLYGNVVRASHGASRSETLGSGNAAKGLQSFTLKQSPLTFLPATTPSGVQSTLQISVNDVRWKEATDLTAASPNDRIYIARNDDTSTTILFGDGQNGSRLPTGTENVRARFRVGLGQVGNVRAETISLLTSRPLGVTAVINPLPANGGGEPETLENARQNAPHHVLTFERLVSASDYADFARNTPGIGKAFALLTTDGKGQIMRVIVTGQNEASLDPTGNTITLLRQNLRGYGDVHLAVVVEPHISKPLYIQATVGLLPDSDALIVQNACQNALHAYFAFSARALGMGATASEVVALLQSVTGVAYVNLTGFGLTASDKSQNVSAGINEVLFLPAQDNSTLKITTEVAQA